MRGRKRNGFVTLNDDQGGNKKDLGKIKKSASKQRQSPQRNEKSKRKNFFFQPNQDYGFRRELEKDGSLSINEMASDGNCLFRSLSDQLYHDYGAKHEYVRQEVCDYIEAMEEEFSGFLVLDENEEEEDAANFEEYVATMRSDGEWGGNLELVAASKLYGRDIKVFSLVASYTINHGNEKSGGPYLMVSYHDNDHYNSVRQSNGKSPPPPIKAMPKNSTKNSKMASEGASTDGSSKTTDTAQTALSIEDDVEEELCKSCPGEVSMKEKSSAKRKQQCPCGSRIKYKDCCRKKNSMKKGGNKNELCHDNDTKSSESSKQLEDEDESQVEGVFRMLKI